MQGLGRIFVLEVADSRVPEMSSVQDLSFVLQTEDETVCASGMIRFYLVTLTG